MTRKLKEMSTRRKAVLAGLFILTALISVLALTHQFRVVTWQIPNFYPGASAPLATLARTDPPTGYHADLSLAWKEATAGQPDRLGYTGGGTAGARSIDVFWFTWWQSPTAIYAGLHEGFNQVAMNVSTQVKQSFTIWIGQFGDTTVAISWSN